MKRCTWAWLAVWAVMAAGCGDTRISVPDAGPRPPVDPCEACTSAQVCVAKRCVQKDCTDRKCGEVQACFADRCASMACDGIACPMDTACANGACYGLTCGDGGACGPGEVCVDGACAEAACVGISCPAGTNCLQGYCVEEACDNGLCPTGEVCFEEVCTETDCLGFVCPLDMRCVAGRCTACPEGTVPGPGDTCLPAGDAGTPCTAGHQCATGICADGVCCDTACRDACQSCATGTCLPVAAGTGDAQCYGYACAGDGGCNVDCSRTADCDGAWWCEATGRCVPRQQDGSACEGSDECLSGQCVEGVCCNSACDDGCGTCRAPGQVGQCTPVAAGTTCRESQGVCNPAETCDGTSTACPQDAFTQNDTTCGTTATDPWGPCVLPPSCTSTGTRSRTVHTFTCTAGQCVEKETEQPGTCTANPTGNPCGTAVYGKWSLCNWSGTCDTTATQTRTVTRSTCNASGSCVAQPQTTETRTCTRVTDGITCQAEVPGPWSGCTYAKCANTAPDETRSVTRYACSAGACQPTVVTQKRACSRNAEGTTCGTATYPEQWGPCGGYSGFCDNTGTRTRKKVQPTCKSGACVNVNSQEQGTCSRNQNGLTCGANVADPQWSTCSGFTEPCGNTGTQSRSVRPQICSGGSCVKGSPIDTNTQSCARDTNGTSCGSTVGEWSDCGGYSGTCDETGTKTQTVTQKVCSGGSCVSGSTSTNTAGCSRSTTGVSCGQQSSFESCNPGYAAPTCASGKKKELITTTYTCSSGGCRESRSSTAGSCCPN